MCLNNYTRAFLHDYVHNGIDIFFDFSNDVLITQYAQDNNVCTSHIWERDRCI